jgi:hypothetical protein
VGVRNWWCVSLLHWAVWLRGVRWMMIPRWVLRLREKGILVPQILICCVGGGGDSTGYGTVGNVSFLGGVGQG